MRRAAAVLGVVCCGVLALSAALPALADTAGTLTVDQIVAKNAAARGGLEAWRKIHTMIWTGHVQSAHAPLPEMPFLLEMERPNKTHFEIKGRGEAASRVFDGVQGWTLRPARSGRPELLPYTAEELRSAKDAQGIDGPLMDHQAKGIAVSLDGMDDVEGRKAYRLNIKLPSGTAYHLWLDAKTFLDVKYDRTVRDAFGRPATVSVFYRDYRTVGGLQLPFTIETAAGEPAAGKSGAYVASDKMVIDRIVLNPPVGKLAFARPALFGRKNEVSVEAMPEPAGTFPPPGFPRLNRPAFAMHGKGH